MLPSRYRLALPWLLALLVALPAAMSQDRSSQGFPGLSSQSLNRLGIERIGNLMIFSEAGFDSQLTRKELSAIIRENGIHELRVDTYRNTAGVIRAQVFIMQDAKASFSVYGFWKSPDGTALTLGDGATQWPGQILFWQNDHLVSISYEEIRPELEQAAQAIAEAVSQAIGTHELGPPLIQFLPVEGRVLESERYVLGRHGLARSVPELENMDFGFKDSAEIAVSEYRNGEEFAKLLLIGYPTMALARNYYSILVPALQDADLRGHGYFTKRTGTVVAVLIGTLGIENARRLLDKIEWTYAVKWIYRKDQPGPANPESMSLLGTVVASILLTALFGAGTIAGGLALGGSRFLMRRLAPNNFLDDPERVGLIRLNLPPGQP